jgi:hypothetical protein
VGGLCHNLRTIQFVSPLGTRDQQCHVCLGDAGARVVGIERSHIVFKAISAVKLKTRSLYCWLHCTSGCCLLPH